MKALVTGSEGFVGRHMVTELYRRGYRVEQCDLKTGDDLVDVCRSSLKTVYDLVVHCAFHVGGRAAIDGEPRLLARNLQLDSALFDWATTTGQGRVLYFSSSAAYPVHLQVSPLLGEDLVETDIDLDDVEQPDARYGWAKLCGEQNQRYEKCDQVARIDSRQTLPRANERILHCGLGGDCVGHRAGSVTVMNPSIAGFDTTC